MNIPTPDTSLKWYNFYQKFLQPHVEEFLNEDSTNSQFKSILNAIAEKKAPIIISEKIGIVLQKKFFELQNGMQFNDEEFYSLMIEVVRSIENHLDMSINVWKDRIIYFRDVTEVWIACEPMLDLIDNEEGSFDLLERQLRHVNQITYFLKNVNLFHDLVNILKERYMDTGKLRCVHIPKKLPYPVVIYHAKSYRHGMTGKYHPEIVKNLDGHYIFKKKLETDWMKYLTRNFIEKHYQDLYCHLQTKMS
jgi:hypothetical protein